MQDTERQSARRLICQGEVRPGLIVPPHWVDDPDITYPRTSAPRPAYYVSGPDGPVPVWVIGRH